MLDLPKYMNDVLHFSISDNGFYSSLPQLMKLIMALLTGALNDWLIISNYLTITNGRKLFVAIGMYNSFQFFAHPLTIIRNHLRWTKKRCHTESDTYAMCVAHTFTRIRCSMFITFGLLFSVNIYGCLHSGRFVCRV